MCRAHRIPDRLPSVNRFFGGLECRVYGLGFRGLGFRSLGLAGGIKHVFGIGLGFLAMRHNRTFLRQCTGKLSLMPHVHSFYTNLIRLFVFWQVSFHIWDRRVRIQSSGSLNEVESFKVVLNASACPASASGRLLGCRPQKENFPCCCEGASFKLLYWGSPIIYYIYIHRYVYIYIPIMVTLF